MKTLFCTLLGYACFLFPLSATPVVSNITASQRPGTALVDVRYDVSATTPHVITALRVSSDSGQTFTVPVASLSGDVGTGVAVGTGKTITWNAGLNWPGRYSTTMCFQVTADDAIPADFAYIPGGNFVMGRTSGDTDADAPPVTVNLSAFTIGKYEVTMTVWDEVRTWALANGYTDLSAGSVKPNNHPAQTISWFDMVKWCNARSQKEGLSPVYSLGGIVMKTGSEEPTADWSANGYRLPTEAEWEKAARGGVSGKRFPWNTDTISHSQANYIASTDFTYDLSGSANSLHPTYGQWPPSVDYTYTSPVGAFSANGYGLYDVAGNVVEWCWDFYSETSYVNNSTNPRGPSSGAERVRRGGSWDDRANECRLSSRESRQTDDQEDHIGFRLVRNAVPMVANTAPAILSQPVAEHIAVGGTASLAVTVTGALPLTFQWYQGAVGVTSSPVGTNSASFTSPALSSSTSYWVRVSNALGTIDSTAATMQLISPVPADFALIPAGVFTMGNVDADADPDSPETQVSLSAYIIGKHEVTKTLWDEVRTWALANGYTDLPAGAGKASNHPVHSISWFDMIKWCNARSQKEGLSPVYLLGGSVMKTGSSTPTPNWSANGYRLPTEAEWEKAARGGPSGQRFPWGDDTISHSQANYYASAQFWYDLSGSTEGTHPTYTLGDEPFTSPVGAFTANSYGLFDVAGNVWEKCWDWYGETSYVNNSSDPRGPASGIDRIDRGGSWNQEAFFCRASHRGFYDPSISDIYTGFRLVRNALPLLANTAPTVYTQPVSQQIPVGGTTSLAVTVAGAQPLTYQWYQGAVGVTSSPVGTNSASFTSPALSSSTSYWVRVSNALGSVDSAAAAVTVSVAPGVVTQPSSQVLFSGNTATLSVVASGSSPLTYQWYQGAVGDTAAPVGTNSSSFTTPVLSSTASYWVRISNALATVDSALATITVSSPITIDSQPSSSTVISGSRLILSVEATGTASLAYQWYQGLLGDTSQPVGSNLSYYLTPVLNASTSYWVRIRSADGSTSADSALASVEVISLPIITTQPRSTSIVTGGRGVITVSASSAAPLQYQWYQGSSGDTSLPMVSSNSPSLSTPILTSTTSYWVRITNTVGSVDSSAATITVWTPPAITTQPAWRVIAENTTATIAVAATGLSVTPLTYQWYQGTVGNTTSPVGGNSPNFTTPSLSTTTSYWVRVTNDLGTADSILATVSIQPTTPADFAYIPGGNFVMGRTSGDTDSIAPSVTVNVSAFFMGKYEVTKALWDEVRTWALANGYSDLSAGHGKASDHPVQFISWFDMIKWCNARSQKEGLSAVYSVSGAVMKTGSSTPTPNWSANGYRLPTEAEWEKAARGGVSGKRFPSGSDTISHSEANYYANSNNSYDLSGSVNNYHPTYVTVWPYTSPVGAFSANGYGLHDMAGNVKEWCWDWFADSTYVNNSSDPRGPTSGTNLVIRGGRWHRTALNCRAAGRDCHYPSFTFYDLGFRVVRSSVP